MRNYHINLDSSPIPERHWRQQAQRETKNPSHSDAEIETTMGLCFDLGGFFFFGLGFPRNGFGCWGSLVTPSRSDSSTMDLGLCGVVFWFGLGTTTRTGTRVSKTQVPHGF